MKKVLLKNAGLIWAAVIVVLVVFVACDKSDVEVADTKSLTALIDSCKTISNSATTGDYPQAAITTFNSKLATATTAVANKSISQTEVNNLVVQLREAKNVFLAAAYNAIPASSLIMGLSFNEGTGEQLKTAGKPWTAVLKKGPSEIFGTATNLPAFVDGKIGKGMYFKDGAHLEISNYAANDLMPKQLSIAVWVKPELTKPGNYIISYNYWNSWKFQLQEQNKPFFTVHTDADGWVDADNQADNSAKNGAWTHLIVSLNMETKVLTFYVNGVSTMKWDATTKPGLKGTSPWKYKKTLPLMIGACTTYEEQVAEWNWDWSKKPEAWDCFVGSMDELKVYNIALTDGQAAKLYKEESK